MRLDINLATQPYQDTGQFWRRWGTVLAACILVTVILFGFTVREWLTVRQDRAQIKRFEERIASLTDQENQARSFLDEPQNRSTRDRSLFLNDLFHRKAFSWTLVFQDLEQVMPARLHVVSIHPELTPDNQLQIKLVVAGESRDRALELVRKMEDSQHFRETAITQEVSRAGQQGNEVRFDIGALYVPETANSSAGGAP
ncbi:MAG TPA: PilN domain-containing protein [Terriglobales bacterium]|jgi:type IV pilus assembly protein PilN